MEFAEAFLLEYQRKDGGEWIRFRNKDGAEVSFPKQFKLFNCGTARHLDFFPPQTCSILFLPFFFVSPVVSKFCPQDLG